MKIIIDLIIRIKMHHACAHTGIQAMFCDKAMDLIHINCTRSAIINGNRAIDFS